MKKKIIFWIDDSHVLFGVAKFLQEKYDYELFSVYDLNHISKNFYKNQKLVRFNKVWFWRDFLSSTPHKPDIYYLKQFEKKYNINLWLLAYSERKFHGFIEFHKFTHDEILSITEDECKIFEKILDETKPDFLFMGITDLHRNNLFKQLCDARGISVLMLWPIRFGHKSMISNDYDFIDNFDKSSIQWQSNNSSINYQDYLVKNDPRKATEKKFINRDVKLGLKNILERHLKFLIFICNNEYRNFYENWGKTRIRFLFSKEFIIPFILKRWYRQKFLDKHASKKINPNDQFIYFPLQHEPERTLLLSAPFNTNQLEIIIQIAKSIPVGYQLFVKEHYSMRIEAWRKRDFYKKILDLPNVKLIHPLMDGKELLKKCSLVATVAGTSSMEAGFFQKPSIVFANTSFDYLPFVVRVKSFEELPNLIRSLLEKKFDFSLLGHYIQFNSENGINVNSMQMMYDVVTQLHDYNGLTREVNISSNKMEKFLNDHKKNYEELVSAYINKIEKINNHD